MLWLQKTKEIIMSIIFASVWFAQLRLHVFHFSVSFLLSLSYDTCDD